MSVVLQTTVVSLRSGLPWDVYVGRASSAPDAGCAGADGCFGNPVVPGGKRCFVCRMTHPDPGDTLPCFQQYFLHRVKTDPAYRVAVQALRGKRIACWCAPLEPCHARTIAAWVDGQPLPAASADLTGEAAAARIASRFGEQQD